MSRPVPPVWTGGGLDRWGVVWTGDRWGLAVWTGGGLDQGQTV